MNIKDSMSIKLIIKALAMLAVLVLIISACGKKGQFSDLEEHIKQLLHLSATKHITNAEAKLNPPIPVTFKNGGNRSPFEGAALSSAKSKVANSPLQAFPLSVLRFVGTVTRGNVVSAFVMTPDNLVYQVTVGDLIGDHQGVVASVQAGGLNVMEQTTADGKNEVRRLVSLQLKDAD